MSNLITTSTSIDCGALTIEFFNDDNGQTELDPALFVINMDSSAFTTLYTEDVNKKGEYPIKYRVFYNDYPENVVTLSEPFTIKVIDPCEDMVSVSASTAADQEYVITQAAKTYQIPAFSVSPDWC